MTYRKRSLDKNHTEIVNALRGIGCSVGEAEPFFVIEEGVIVLPFPPSLNMLYPTNKTGRRFTSKRGEIFKKAVAEIVANRAVLQGELIITIRLFRPKKQGDIDNYPKAILDSLKGFCFVDDKQICELHVYRFDDKKNPRVEVKILEKEFAELKG